MIRHGSLERKVRDLCVIAGDCAIAVFVLVATVELRRNVHVPGTEGLLAPQKFALDVVNLFVSASTMVLALAVNGFYNARVTSRHRPSMAAAMLMQVVLLAVVSTAIERPYPRTILLALPILQPVLLLGWRRLLTAILPFRSRETVLVGSAAEAERFIASLGFVPDRPVRFIGVVSDQPEGDGRSGIPWIGSLGDGRAEENLKRAEEVLCLSSDADLRLRLFETRGPAGYLLAPSTGDSLMASTKLGWIGDQPLIEVAARGAFGFGALMKRVTDIVLSAVLLITSLPLFLAIAIAIAVDSSGPVLLWQRRTGRGGVPFAMAKFRTLHTGSHEQSDLVTGGDKRVTRVGYWLRRHRLDELPQLVNVLRGDMSLVGPRPERIEIHERLASSVPAFSLRLIVRPGLTGLAQVLSEYETEPATKLRYDLTYICAWSLWLDLRILAQSLSTALSGRGM